MMLKDNCDGTFSIVAPCSFEKPKPLSDEEIFNLTAWKKNPYELYVEMEKDDMIAFARAIEERHGIKQHEN